MTTNTDERDEAALDALFAAGRQEMPRASDDFMKRLEADMGSALPRPASLPVADTSPGFGWLAGLFTASGLTGATLAGVWIGFAMPETLDSFAGEAESTVALSSFLPGSDLGSVFDE